MKAPFLSDAFTWPQTLCLVPCWFWTKVVCQASPTYYYKAVSVLHFWQIFTLLKAFWGKSSPWPTLWFECVYLPFSRLCHFWSSSSPTTVSSPFQCLRPGVYNALCLCNQQLSPASWLEHCTRENNEPTEIKCGSILSSCLLGVILFCGGHLAFWETWVSLASCTIHVRGIYLISLKNKLYLYPLRWNALHTGIYLYIMTGKFLFMFTL